MTRLRRSGPARPVRRTAGRAAAAALILAASSAHAIVVRHDRDDAAYRSLGRGYPMVCRVDEGLGTLIAPRWVITAAHVAGILPREGAVVRFGDRVVPVAEVFRHPRYADDDPAAHRDLALLRLAEPVVDIRPVRLYRADDEPGQRVVFVGDGLTGDGRTGPREGPRVLRAAHNTVERVRPGWLEFVFDAPPAGDDLEGISGPGDSGGPALLEQGGKLYLLGVSAYNEGAPECTYGTTEHYSRISDELPWIQGVMSGKIRRDAAPGGSRKQAARAPATSGPSAAQAPTAAPAAPPAAAGADPYDPVAEDPRGVDPAAPARLVETGFVSNGQRVNAILYVARGAGPHPTVVLLHGYPGNEKNLDLAQAMRRAGMNVLVFHYRGSWGSEGEFSWTHALEDTAAAVRFLRSDGAPEARVDPRRIALVGHSFGGFFALMQTARDPALGCAVSIAGVNPGVLQGIVEKNPAMAGAFADALQAGTGPLRGTSGKALVDEILANRFSFELTSHAEALGRKHVLLLAGAQDTVVPIAMHHAPLVRVLASHGGRRVSEVLLDADHAFSEKRITLARTLIAWLQRHCGY